MAYVYKTVNGVRKLVNVPDADKTTTDTSIDSSSVGSTTEGAKYTNMGGAAAASQQDLINQLKQQASGKSSLVTEQMKAASDKTLAQQLAAAGAARGGNQAALQRQLARNQMAQGAELTQQAGQAQLKEQQAAQQNLASLVSQQQQAALAKAQQEASIEAAKVSGEYGLKATKEGSILGQVGGIFEGIGDLFAEGGIAGEDKRSSSEEATKEAERMLETLKKLEELKSSKVKKYADGGIIAGDEDDEDNYKKESVKAFLKQLLADKEARYKKSTGKEAPKLFKGDQEIREEREVKNKKEIEDSAYRNGFEDGGTVDLDAEFENEVNAPSKEEGKTVSGMAKDFGKNLLMGEVMKDKGVQQGMQMYDMGKKAYEFGDALFSKKFSDGGMSSYRKLGNVEKSDSTVTSKAAGGNEGFMKIGEKIFGTSSSGSKAGASNPSTSPDASIDMPSSESVASDSDTLSSIFKADGGLIDDIEVDAPEVEVETTEVEVPDTESEDYTDEVDAEIATDDEGMYEDLGDIEKPTSVVDAAKSAVGNDQLHKIGKMVASYFTGGASSSTGADKGLSAEGAKSFGAANGGLAKALKKSPPSKQEIKSSGFGAILAAQANLNKRLEELESKNKKRK